MFPLLLLHCKNRINLFFIQTIILLILGTLWIGSKPCLASPSATQIKKIVASDGAFEDHYGKDVAIDGETVIVGALNEDPGGVSAAGSAYIYIYDGGNWTQQKKLTASDPVTEDRFGSIVDIDGDYVVIGCNSGDTGGLNNAGKAYIFHRNQGGADHWGLVKKLTAPTPAAGDLFGHWVAIEGDTVAIGAKFSDEAATDAGAVYVFSKDQGGADNWGWVKTLTASDAAVDDRMYQVAIDEDTIVTGATSDSHSGFNNAGAAYVYERNEGGANNWGQVKKLVAGDPETDANFAVDVTVSGDWIAIGTWRENHSGLTNAGSVYLFSRNQGGTNNWGLYKKITAGDPGLNDYFGHRVSIEKDVLIAGAYYDDLPGKADAGSAYGFHRNEGGADNWGQFSKMTASDSAASDRFSNGVCLSGKYLLIGSRLDDDKGLDSGSAYIFELSGITSTPPSTSGIANVNVDEDSADTVIDLYSAFEDQQDSDAMLTYTIQNNTNTALFDSTTISSGQLTLDYAANANGTAEITVQAEDTDHMTVETAFQVTVNPVDDVPTVSSDSFNTNEDYAVAMQLQGNDIDSSNVTYVIVSHPSRGFLTNFNAQTGTVTYNPNSNYSGSDSFTFKLNDGTSDSSVARIDISISSSNDPPYANSQSVSTNENTSVSITLTGGDSDGDSLTYMITSGPSNGSVSGFGSSSGQVTYTPHENFYGNDSFQFCVSDGSRSCSPTTVDITVIQTTMNANAGISSAFGIRFLLVGQTYSLEGTASGGSGNYSYSWNVISGPATDNNQFSSTSTTNPSFTPAAVGEYTLQLTVSNGTDSAIDTVSFQAYAPLTVDAGPSTGALLGQEIHFGFSIRDDAGNKVGSPSTTVDEDNLDNASGDPLVIDDYNDKAGATTIDASIYIPVVLKGVSKLSELSFIIIDVLPVVGSDTVYQNETNREIIFKPTVSGEYTFQITVSDGLQVASDTVTIHVYDSLPISAEIEKRSPSIVGIPVVLHCNASGGNIPTKQTDSSVSDTDTIDRNDSHSYNYEWSVQSGPNTSDDQFSLTTEASPTFTPATVGDYTIQVSVDDGEQEPFIATVSFTVYNPLTADADSVLFAITEETVALTGTASGGNGSYNYEWSVHSGPNISDSQFSSIPTANPTFTPATAGDYTIQVSVGDGIQDPIIATVSFPVYNPLTADADSFHYAITGEAVALTGTASGGLASRYTFQWSIDPSSPASNGTFENAATLNPTFTPNQAGDFILEFTVDDGIQSPVSDTVTITAYDPLMAEAEGAETAPIFQPLPLSAVPTGGNSETYSYQWSIAPSSPAQQGSFDDPTLKNQTFTPNELGEFILQLEVNDDLQPAAITTISFTSTVSNNPREGNHPPVITLSSKSLLRADQGKNLKITVIVSDEDSNPLIVFFSLNAPVKVKGEAAFMKNKYVDIQLNTSQLGIFPFTVYAYDGSETTSLDIAYLVGENNPPQISIEPASPIYATVAESCTFTATVTDPDGHEVEVLLSPEAPAVLLESLSSATQFVYELDTSQLGEFHFTIQATDSFEPSEEEVVYHVAVPSTPTPIPLLVDAGEDTEGVLGESYELNGTASSGSGKYLFGWSILEGPDLSEEQIQCALQLAKQTTLVLDAEPLQINTGDFDGDEYQDLALIYLFENEIHVKLNDRAGTFSEGLTYPTSGAPADIEIADLNQDNFADIVTANIDNDSISVFINNQDGTFLSEAVYPAGESPYNIEIGDPDGEGDLDILVGNAYAQSISILPNHGDGTFGDLNSIHDPFEEETRSLIFTDMNNDGYQDAIVSTSGSSSLLLLINHQDGTFASPITIETGDSPISLVRSHRMNGGNYPGLVLLHRDSNTVSMMQNTGNERFSPPLRIPAGMDPFCFTCGDMDCDGDQDLLVLDMAIQAVSFIRNLGNGSFDNAESLEIDNPPVTFLRASDLDRDGRPDLIMANNDNHELYTYENTTDPAKSIFKPSTSGEYTLQLTVNDGVSEPVSDTVIYRINEATPSNGNFHPRAPQADKRYDPTNESRNWIPLPSATPTPTPTPTQGPALIVEPSPTPTCTPTPE